MPPPRDPETAWDAGTPYGGPNDPDPPPNSGRYFGRNPNFKTPKLKLVDPLALDGVAVPERPWLVPNWIPMNQVTMLGGDGGLGKSLLAMQLLTAAATGGPWIGLPVRHVRALGVFAEDDADELHRRQARINAALGIGWADLADLTWYPAERDATALMTFGREDLGEPTEFFQQVHNAAQDHGAQVIVLDSLHDFFAGNENWRGQVRQFIRLLRQLAMDCNAAVVVTAHPSLAGLQSGSGLSGSTAWNNAVRSRLYLNRPKADEGAEADEDDRVLSRLKANYASARDVVRLRWRDGVFLRNDPAGGMLGTIDRHATDRLFLRLLDAVTSDNRPVSDNDRAANFAPRVFARRPDREGRTRQDLAQAMERLFANNEIRVVPYGSPSNQTRKITRAEAASTVLDGSQKTQ